MEKVIQACQIGQNALLESPTGTGKTLCLLAATLSWQKRVKRLSVLENREEDPKIIYCSRTHTQISQVVRELKKTNYMPKISIVASRDKLCVNGQFNGYKGTALNSLCKKSRELNKNDPNCCQFYKNTLEQNQGSIGIDYGLFDIEDLHSQGIKHKLCPYYLQKNKAAASDLILMPYNYLMDPKIRENYKIDFQNSIIILDEAHNIEKVSEDVTSFDINVQIFNTILTELTNLIVQIEGQIVQGGMKMFQSNIHNILEIMCLTKNFYQFMLDVQFNSFEKDHQIMIKDMQQQFPKDIVFEGYKIFDLFFQGTNYTSYQNYNGPENFQGLNPKNFGHWIHVFEKCIADLNQLQQKSTPLLEKWWDAINKVI